MTNIIKKFFPLALILLFPCLLFWRVFFGNIVVSGDFTGSDLLDLHLPFKYLIHNNLSNFSLPLWEKNVAMGFPVLAEGQSGVFYPINLVLSFVSPETSLNISIILVFSVALLSSYIYFRLLGKSRALSLFGAVTFAFSAFFVTRFKHLNLVNVASLFPLLLVFTKLYFDTKKIVMTLFAAMTLSLMIFAGHPQITFYNGLIFCFYAIFESIRTYKKDPAFAISGLFSIITIAVVVGLALSSVQILPTLELTVRSPRAIVSDSSLGSFPFHLKNMIGFISPYYWGNPAIATYLPDIRTHGIFWENANYIGLLGISFALLRIFLVILRRNGNVYDKFFIALAGLSFLLILGTMTPVFPAIFSNVPLMNLFRFPNRFNLYLIFSLSFLSIGGLEYVSDKLKKLRKRKLQKDPDNPDQIEIKWPFNKTQTVSIFIAFTMLDLFVFANAYVGYASIDKLNPKPEFIELLSNDVDHYRTYSMTQYMDSPYQSLGWKNDIESILDSRKSLAPNNNIIFNLPYFSDRGWFEGGLSIARRNEVENFILYKNTDEALTGKVLGMYSVKHILSFSEYIGIEIFKESEIELGDRYALNLNLLRNDQAIPRLYFVPEAEIITNQREVFNRVTDLNHLPTRTVILEENPRLAPPTFEESLTDFQDRNSVRIISESNTRIVINAEIEDHGFMVLNDTYYPGWKVRVNEIEDKIFQANYLSRAVELTPGDHRIEFYYDPLSYKIGKYISLITLMVLLIFLSTNLKTIRLTFLRSSIKK